MENTKNGNDSMKSARDMLAILSRVPPDKRSLVVEVTDAFLRGMEAQATLDRA